MPSTWLLLLAVLSPAAAGLMTMLLPRPAVAPRVALMAAGMATAFLLVLSQLSLGGGLNTGKADETAAAYAPDHPSDAHVSAAETAAAASPALPWIPDFHLDIAFLPDGLGGFFALLVSGIGVLIVLYARGYFGGLPPPDSTAHDDLFRFYPTLGFFATAMLGLVLSDYILLTLLFWELTSISSFLLIGWDRSNPRAVRLAIQAFLTTGLGGLFLLGGIALLGSATATALHPDGLWRWSELIAAAQAGELPLGTPAMAWAFGLIFIGAAAKSAQFPLHYWLPGAMAAPTPVSAYLHSATMVKAGVFLMGRCYPVFNDLDLYAWLLIPFGGVTMLYAGITAVCKHDLKQIFAYTTVSQLGLLMAMYGLGGIDFDDHGHAVAALDFDVTQIANHAFYKAPLFITAGAIGHVASRSLPHLKGALWEHPAICITMLAAGYALAALPGSISFNAKELFLYAGVHAAETHPGLWLLVVATLLTAACNVAIFIRLLLVFTGRDLFSHLDIPEEHAHHHAHEHGLGAQLIWLPAVPLVALQFVGGLATPLWEVFALPFESNAGYFAKKGIPWLPSFTSLPLYLSVAAVVAGVVLALTPLLRRAHADVFTRVYPAAQAGVERLSRVGHRVSQTGNLRLYISAALLSLLIGFVGAVLHDPRMFEPIGAAFATFFESTPGVIIGLLICCTSLVLPLTESRLIRVLMLGACGFAMVSMYVVYQAPDLALTQLFFEIISVLLFVFVLRLLPSAPMRRNPARLPRIALAVASGVMLGWLTLIAASAEPDPTAFGKLGNWFTWNTYSDHTTGLIPGVDGLADGRGGGGFNIVNVILVDFRGFDTLGEICVLGVAALGVWSMLFRREGGAAEAARR